MIRRPPRSTQSSSSAASDVYKRQVLIVEDTPAEADALRGFLERYAAEKGLELGIEVLLSLIHISEPTRPY